MDALDGNAIGGLLREVFDRELTDATGVCGHCNNKAVVAECEVYLGGPGAVVRCRTCHGLLMVFARVRGVVCVDLGGLQALEPASTSGRRAT
jgi:hypothetical protein